MTKTYKISARLSASKDRNVKDFGIENTLTFMVDPKQDENVIKDILIAAYGMTQTKIDDLWDTDSPIDKYHSNVVAATRNIKFAGSDIKNCDHLGSFIYKKRLDKEGNPIRSFQFWVYKTPHESDAAFKEAHLGHKEIVMVVDPIKEAFCKLNGTVPEGKEKEVLVFSDLEITV